MQIRPAQPHDLDAILALEQASFPSPWSGEMYALEFERELGVFLVAEEIATGVARTEELIGYVCAWVVEDECHLLKLAVRPESRRKGMGSALLSELTAAAMARGADKFWLEVRENNLAALCFYRRHDYLEFGIRKSYYSDTGEDAVVMAKFLRPAGPRPGAFDY